MSRKIALVLNDGFSMFHFRRGLISSLVSKGLEVTVIVPPSAYRERLESLGARYLAVPMARFVSPLHDLLLFARLYRLFRTERFDIVHNMTIKPNIFGTVAAKLARAPKIICLISGLGFVFAENQSFRSRISSGIAKLLYRAALPCCHKVWFQNADDCREMIERGLVRSDQGVVIRSGGIDLDEFSPDAASEDDCCALRAELNIPPRSRCVVMVAARMLWSKGVREFVEAAKTVSSHHHDWYFVMLCPFDPGSPDSVSEEYFSISGASNLRIVTDFRSDVKTFIALGEIIVLPSFYREGVPRSLLEALSMAKPIITTDHPGCREVVDEGVNGFLVPIRDSRVLSERIRILIADPQLRSNFGERSRLKAKREFAQEIVTSRILSELYGENAEAL